jgi:hypothetical protein
MPRLSGITSSSSQLVAAAVARQQVGLDRRAQRHHLVGVEIIQRRLAEKLADGLLDVRHTRGTAHHHHPLDVAGGELGIAQGAPQRLQGALHQVLRHLVECGTAQHVVDHLAAGQHGGDAHLVMLGQLFLGDTRMRQQGADIRRRQSGETVLLQQPAIDAAVKIVAAQREIAAAARRHAAHGVGWKYRRFPPSHIPHSVSAALSSP